MSLDVLVSEGDKESVQTLLNSGISPTLKSIQYAILQRDNEILALLLEKNMHILPSNLLKTPIENNDAETVRMLIDYGVRIHDNDEYALRLASYMAEETGNFSIVKLLLNAGANVYADLLIDSENTELLKILLQYTSMNENNIKQFLSYPHLRKDILKRNEEILHVQRIENARNQEEKNEAKRQLYLEEIKKEIEIKDDSFISQNCASTESLYGDSLNDTDDLVIFEIGGANPSASGRSSRTKGDCYLRKELKLLRSDQHVRGTGERAYRLPWSGVWISENTKNLAERWDDNTPIKLVKNTEEYVGYDKNNYLYIIEPLESL